MSEATRTNIILTDDINTTLDGMVDEHGGNKSAYVRIAVAYWLLHEHSLKVDHIVKRGGRREKRVNS